MRVMDYETGSILAGEATAELAEQSERAESGAVPAYLDDHGLWQYVAPSMVEQMRRTQDATVLTVYVED